MRARDAALDLVNRLVTVDLFVVLLLPQGQSTEGKGGRTSCQVAQGRKGHKCGPHGRKGAVHRNGLRDGEPRLHVDFMELIESILCSPCRLGCLDSALYTIQDAFLLIDVLDADLF